MSQASLHLLGYDVMWTLMRLIQETSDQDCKSPDGKKEKKKKPRAIGGVCGLGATELILATFKRLGRRTEE